MSKFYVNLNPYYFKYSFSSEKLNTELFHSALLRYAFYFKKQRQFITMSKLITHSKLLLRTKRSVLKETLKNDLLKNYFKILKRHLIIFLF